MCVKNDMQWLTMCISLIEGVICFLFQGIFLSCPPSKNKGLPIDASLI